MPDGQIYQAGIADGMQSGGIFALTSPEFEKAMPAHWLTYFAVDGIEATVAKVREHGRCPIRDVFEVQGVGHIASIQEPSGAVCGCMTPSEMPSPG